MIIVISPAKSLDFETIFDCKTSTIPQFAKEAEKLVLEMQKFSVSDLEKLMKISKKLAELNFDRFKKFYTNPTRQAILAFDGDVYEGIEKTKYDKTDFAFAQSQLRILSGLYGLLKPLDMIRPYRLEMGTDFKKTNFPIKNLYDFWENKITEELKNSGAKELINLASEEYFSAINTKKIPQKIINIIFKEKSGDKLRVIGINAKKARGLMVNFIIKNRITEPQNLKKFSAEKYRFDKALSTEKNWVFVR